MGEQRKDGKMLFGCIHLVFLQELFRATGEFVNSCFFVAWSFCLAFGFFCVKLALEFCIMQGSL